MAYRARPTRSGSSPGTEELCADHARPRILHVLGSLSLGGIETWLMHMMRQERRFDVRHELLLTNDLIGPYEDEARRLGIAIHRLPLRDGRLGWFRRFHHLLHERGPFLAVHSHEDPRFAAPLLAVARLAGVPVRIAHSHSARSRGADYPPTRKMMRRLALPMVRRAATRLIGVSEDAVAEIAGSGWRTLPHAGVLDLGFDFRRFADAAGRAEALRARLGIAPGAAIIGNVARMVPTKNHDLLIRAFAIHRAAMPNARLVLVGEGHMQAELAGLAERLGLSGSVHFVGTTDDVPAYMALFDLFVLPSFSEGLGIACVEAQAAGTRLLISDAVPAEVMVVPGAGERLAIACGAAAWGAAMTRILAQPRTDARADWLPMVEGSRFGLDRCIAALNALYVPDTVSLGTAAISRDCAATWRVP